MPSYQSTEVQNSRPIRAGEKSGPEIRRLSRWITVMTLLCERLSKDPNAEATHAQITKDSPAMWVVKDVDAFLDEVDAICDTEPKDTFK